MRLRGVMACSTLATNSRDDDELLSSTCSAVRWSPPSSIHRAGAICGAPALRQDFFVEPCRTFTGPSSRSEHAGQTTEYDAFFGAPDFFV